MDDLGIGGGAPVDGRHLHGDGVVAVLRVLVRKDCVRGGRRRSVAEVPYRRSERATARVAGEVRELNGVEDRGIGRVEGEVRARWRSNGEPERQVSFSAEQPSDLEVVRRAPG